MNMRKIDVYDTAEDAYAVWENECVMHQVWAFAKWLYCTHFDDRLEQLREYERVGIGIGDTAKEIKRLEKAAKKEAK